jgi:hypothetical protein
MQFGQSTGEAILNEIVRRGAVARERSGIAPQARDLRLDTSIDFRHNNPPLLTTTLPVADRGGTKVNGGL